MSLLDEFGLDADTFQWQDLGLCRGIPIYRILDKDGNVCGVYDPMFDTYESDKTTAAQIDAMCLTCPVMKQCFADGVENKQDGVHGGIYLTSGAVDKNRNAHKTPGVWQAIADRIKETDNDSELD